MKNNSIGKRIKHREDMFLRRLFGLLARMAKIDGKVDAWEAHAAEGAFARFPRATARRKFCVAVFNSAKNGGRRFVTLPPSSRESGPIRRILSGYYGTPSVFIKWEELEAFK